MKKPPDIVGAFCFAAALLFKSQIHIRIFLICSACFFLLAILFNIKEKNKAFCCYEAGFLCWIFYLFIDGYGNRMPFGVLAIGLWISGAVLLKKNKM